MCIFHIFVVYYLDESFHLYNDLFLLTICNFKTSCKYLRFPLAFSYLNVNDSRATSRVIVIFDVCMFLSRRRFHTCRLSINWWSPLKEIILILLGNNQSRLHTTLIIKSRFTVEKSQFVLYVHKVQIKR